MIRQLLVLAVIFSVGMSLLLVPVSVNACGEKEPETLLALYKNSDSIYIATFERTAEMGVEEDDEYYTLIKVSHEFSISSTLKGEPQKFVAISDTEYRSKDPDAVQTETVDEDHDEHVNNEELRSGDRVMLFVKNRSQADGGGIVYTDFIDGIKKLNSSEMAIYEKRVNELNGIFADGAPDDQIIVDWLISMIEDPVTRWEGAYELLASAQNNEWRAEHEAAIKTKKEKGEQLEEWEIEISANFEDPTHEYSRRMPYAKLLTAQQKEMIMKLVIERVKEPVKEDETPVYNPKNGDAALLDLAIRWGDGRLAGHLLRELQSVSDKPYQKYELMDKISIILKDKQVGIVKDMFSRVYWQEEDEHAKFSDIKGIYDENGMLNIFLYETPPYEEIAELEEKERSGEIAGKSKKTYGEIRSELVAEFVSKSNLILTTKTN